MDTESMDNSLCVKLLVNEKEKANEVYLRQPFQGKWVELTWSQVIYKSRQLAAFLVNKGLNSGDKVAIISKNCAEWFIADYGIALAGMVSVPLFPNQNKETIDYILEHSETKMVFLGKLDNPEAIQNCIPPIYKTINFNYHKELVTDFQWNDVLAAVPYQVKKFPGPDDLFTIIYSSGTSGKPKGAMYSHEVIANYLELYPKDIKRISDTNYYRLISYLPLAHVYERTAIELGSLTIPCTVSFVESLEKFADNLRDIQPTLFTAVPRIWGVFKTKITQKLDDKTLTFLLKIPLLSGVIKKKIRSQLGLGHCTNCFSGASHLPEEIADFFEKLGIIIQEGYGQTENLAYATFSELETNRKGYVGTPRLGVDIKLSEKQELLIHSNCLMNGYFHQEEAAKEAFSEDGWLRTGDIAEIDNKNRVKIIGRLSDIFKNQKGEFINPDPIEKNFESYEFIENICLIGQGLPGNIMVVNINPSQQRNKEKIIECLKKSLKKINARLQSYEKIGHVLVTADEWTINNNLLTPTLKVKRRVVASEYKDEITKAIAANQTIMWYENNN